MGSFHKMYIICLLCILMQKFVLSEINNPCNVFSTVSTTPPPTSDQGTNQILTQLQAQRTDLLELQIKNLKMQITLDNVMNQTCSENVFLKIEKTIEDKIERVEGEVKKIEKTIEDKIERVEGEVKKIEKTIEDKIERVESEVKKIEKTIEDKIERVEGEVKKIALELEKIYDLLKKANVETTQKIVKYPEDCKEIQGGTTGVYKIKPKLSAEPFEVLCDMDTRGGGWVYVINRFDGIQDFYLNWKDYKDGFGKLTGDFWLGLDHLYELTNSKSTELLIELEDWDGKSVYALYKNFSVGNEQESFKIKYLSGFTGNTSDYMVKHVGYDFRTPDRDDSDKNAVRFHGPWWYHGPGSFHVKLTGTHFERERGTYGTGIHWGSFHGYNYSLKKAKMLIRQL